MKSITLGPRLQTPGPRSDSGSSTLLTQGEWELRTNVLVGPSGPRCYFSCVLDIILFGASSSSLRLLKLELGKAF